MRILSQDSLGTRIGGICTAFSASLWAVITVCHWGQWDLVAAITIFPHWIWGIIGGTALYAAWRLRQRRGVLLFALAWFLTGIYFADNLVPMICLVVDGRRHTRGANESLIRVVTLNCASSPAAAFETAAVAPDVILLQEIPGTNDLARLAHMCFGENGSVVAGVDCAILARGSAVVVGSRLPAQHVQAIVQLTNRVAISVTCLRLVPPAARMDLWNPWAWRDSTNNRRLRARQLLSALDRTPDETALPLIVGGDFNAPANDRVYKLLKGFADTHKEAGRGWGNTVLNRLPIARPDQIWLKGPEAVRVRTVRTKNSDHRMVVADIALQSR